MCSSSISHNAHARHLLQLYQDVFESHGGKKMPMGALQTCESCIHISMQGWLQVEHVHLHVCNLDFKLQQGHAHHVAL